ncbi:MAG: hypothetical protein P4L45_16750, partial [Ignavibacteriaceae bacterium]|nr:hypothetical protein [Ignavibacteriaceae bacterium]
MKRNDNRFINYLLNMLRIEDEYNKVKDLSEKNGKDFLTSRVYKDGRELYILGSFVELLKKSKTDYPEYFQKMNPPDPDFHTYTTDKILYKQIEIVENMHWGRKRGNEDKFPFDRSKYIDDS